CISLEEEVVSVSHHPSTRSVDLHNLAISLHARFEATANLADLNQGIALEEESLELASQPDRPERLRSLAAWLHARFENTATLSDLEKSIAYSEEALKLPQSDETRSLCLSSLVTSLSTRYRHTKHTADLERSIMLKEQVLKLYPSTRTGQPIDLNNLASLNARFSVGKDTTDLDHLIDLKHETLALYRPSHPNRPYWLFNLALSLEDRFDASGSIEDLDKSIILRKEALRFCPTGHSRRHRHLIELVRPLSKRFRHSSNITDLDEAIHLARSALKSLPSHHPRLSRCLEVLSVVQLLHIRQTNRKDTKHIWRRLSSRYSTLQSDNVVRQLRTAADTQNSPARDRLVASLSWIDASTEFHRASLSDAYSTMFDVLDTIITRGYSLESRYSQITTDKRIARAKRCIADAVNFAITENRPRDAAVFLERGRGLLLAQVGHCRMPLDRVKEKDAKLAAQLESVGQQLDCILASDTKPSDFLLNSAADDFIAQSMRLTSQWNTLIKRARKLDGCHDFLMPTTFESLQQGANGGPVIFVNIARSSSHAVIVLHTDDPVTVHLPKASPKSLKRLTKRLLRARSGSLPNYYLALRDLWDFIVGPVVDRLKELVPIGSRIWWCPSATVAELPLHAAGHHFKTASSDKKLPCLFISSYTPSLSALIRSRRATNRPLFSTPRLLITSQPNKEGEVVLNVQSEIGYITQNMPNALLLEGSEGTPDAVLRELPNHSWAHFSCHAY
ncbi:hypothetical protein FRB99_003384, partial [Tulasnella sp. 403]